MPMSSTSQLTPLGTWPPVPVMQVSRSVSVPEKPCTFESPCLLVNTFLSPGATVPVKRNADHLYLAVYCGGTPGMPPAGGGTWTCPVGLVNGFIFSRLLVSSSTGGRPGG